MKLSRYMDIDKYRDLLSTKTLYVPRYDKLGDGLEGSMQDCMDTKEAASQLTQGLRRISGTAQDATHIARTLLECFDPALYENFLQNFTFVSCWHRGVKESSLMWKTYTEKNKQGGIMIKSDVSSLESILKENANSPRSVDTIFQTLGPNPSAKYRISIGLNKVRYLPLGTEINFTGLTRYVCKQKPYADEKEYRIVLQIELIPEQRPNLSLLLNEANVLDEANVSDWDQEKLCDLIIDIWDKMKRSYNTQSSVLTGFLSNSDSNFQSKPHVRFPVNLTSLIKEVVINPYGDVESDMQEIQAINDEFGLSVPVKRSIIKTEAPVPTEFIVELPGGRRIQT